MNKMIKILVALLVSAVVSFADNWSSNSEWNAPKDSVQTVPTEKDSSKTSAVKEEPKWGKSGFFLHGGLLDIGLGTIIHLSDQNGVYLTADLRWQGFIYTQYIRIPLLVYMGGNNGHFVIGTTLLNARSEGDATLEVALGFNVDFGRHCGIDILVFSPLDYPIYDPSIILDFRYVF